MTTQFNATLSNLQNKGLLLQEVSSEDASIISGGINSSIFDNFVISMPQPLNLLGLINGNNDNGETQRTVNEYKSPDGKIYNYEMTETSRYQDFQTL